ncbi:MAG: ATP-dependent helicase Rep [Burkholderiales bacterium]|jgi:ATP-dependent DNA helicase Rep|nr:ATP-dependent helicase Rep [Burkholderiales bacterium]
MYDLMTKLNISQTEAVKYVDGPLLVIAGAGSGKTRVITTKIAYLINSCNYLARNITAITFTNKAAKEMLERTTAITKDIDTRGLIITTFHSLGLKILKQEAHHLGYKTNFSILDSHDSAKIISDIIKTTDKVTVKSLQNQISLWKNAFITPEDLLAAATDNLGLQNAGVFRQYQDTLKTYQAVDFDDLIKLPIELFETNMEVLFKWQQKIHYLLIDEYQDTNICQYRLVKLLTARSGKFTAVGDDDQSIYAWRGANVENLNQLPKDFPDLKVIKLEQNYRSTTTILAAANHVIKNNPKLFAKKLWSEFGGGESIKIVSCKNDEAEADLVIRKIMLGQMQYSNKFSDYAILYRGNYQSRVLEQTLRNYQLPYQISGGKSFFDKAEIKDITAYLRLLINDDDDTAFIRAITTPKRGVGQITLEKLATYAKSRQISLFAGLFEEGFASLCQNTQYEDLSNFGKFINDLQFRMLKEDAKDLLMDLVCGIKYEEYLYEHESSKVAEKKWGNILNLIDWIGKKSIDKTLPELIQTINLISMLDGRDDQELNAIKLSTLHAAKGLEYPYVYLIGCEEGILPHNESISNNMIEEERRLIYVGITRAQKELTISYCQERKSAGELRLVERSRFIDELGNNNIEDMLKRQQSKISDNNELKDRLQQLKALLK